MLLSLLRVAYVALMIGMAIVSISFFVETDTAGMILSHIVLAGHRGRDDGRAAGVHQVLGGLPGRDRRLGGRRRARLGGWP